MKQNFICIVQQIMADMKTLPTVIQFLENGILKEIQTAVHHLKRENNSEVLYTQDGSKIEVNNIVRINGYSFF
jgi:hypothetical protein